MAATHVQGGVSTVTGTRAFGSNVTAGNLLTARIAWQGGSGATTLNSVTDSQGNTWTVHTSTLIYDPTLTQYAQIASCTASASAANTVTATLSSGTPRGISIDEWSSAAGGMEFDVGNAASGNGPVFNSGNVVTTADNGLGIAHLAANASVGNAFTAPTGGFTDQRSYLPYWWANDLYKLDLGPAGTVSAGAALASGADRRWLCSLATFKVAGGAPIGHDLAADNAAQANTASTAGITQAHVLTGTAASQGNTGSTAAIMQTQVLGAASGIQTNAAASPAITAGAAADLTVDPAAQGNAAGTGAINQVHVLATAVSAQFNATTAIAVTQVQVLNAVVAAQGNIAGTGAITLIGTNDLTVSGAVQGNITGSGQVTRVQTLTVSSITQGNRVGTGAINDGIIVEPALVTGIATTAGIKKPGIPANTPAWLRIALEILMGRRGNKITPIAFRALTFSATPTKAECEALYAYTNQVRTAVNEIITRLDS